MCVCVCVCVQVTINTFWLFPLRLILFVVPCFSLGILLCLLSVIGDTLDERKPHPLPGWRRSEFTHWPHPLLTAPPTRFLVNDLGRRLARIFLFGMGFHWIKVRGRPATAAEAPIMVVSPHSSVLDMHIISLFHLPTFVAKREARSVPILGCESHAHTHTHTTHSQSQSDIVTHTLRTIYVDRDNPASRKECTDEIVRRAQDSAAGWPKILIFPEATTHSREVLLQFKKGAFLPGVPVQVHTCVCACVFYCII